jgi:hypothetical protein
MPYESERHTRKKRIDQKLIHLGWKIITAKINNTHLDALEDLLFTELTEKETKKAKEQVKKLWQALVDGYENKAYDFHIQKFKAHQTELARGKKKVKKPVSKPGRYQLAYWLHELEIGETHFIKKNKWFSKKSPGEKVRRISKKTQKHFIVTRSKNGSGWSVKRKR